MRRATQTFVAGAAVLAMSGAVAAQEPVERVRQLYASAAYEDALAAMPSPDGGGKADTEIERYRALCLLALGKDDQAAAALERLTRDNPGFVPSTSDTPPRMQALFRAARIRVLPGLARETYAAAKKAYEAKNHGEARDGFRRTLDLIRSVPDEERGALADLEMLASEFADLAERLNVPPPVALIPPASAPAAAPNPLPTAPVAIRQQMPEWVPPDSAAAGREFVGTIRLLISALGTVEQAVVVKASHPAYDMLVLRAAREWSYRPATIDGRAVPSQKEIEVRLRPR